MNYFSSFFWGLVEEIFDFEQVVINLFFYLVQGCYKHSEQI